MIQALAPDRTDQALAERILPGAARRREDFLDLHPLHALGKVLAVDVIAIAQEIGSPESPGNAAAIWWPVQTWGAR